MNKILKCPLYRILVTIGVGIFLLFISNILILDILVFESNSEFLLETSLVPPALPMSPGSMNIVSESSGETSMKKLYNLNMGMRKYDVGGKLVSLEGPIILYFQSMSNPLLCYQINDIPATCEINFSTRNMEDDNYRVLAIQNDTVYATDNCYITKDGIMSPLLYGEEYPLEMDEAIPSPAAFATLLAEKQGNDYFVYGVAGLTDIECGMQKVFLKLDGENGFSMTYLMKPMIRYDYALSEGSLLYVYSGVSLLLPPTSLPDGIYTMQMYLENGALYQLDTTWHCTAADGQVDLVPHNV